MLNNRAWVAVVLCAVLPVVIGILATGGESKTVPPPEPITTGHWVYVPSQGAAVHVDGAGKSVDATVTVGSASTGSPVLQDQHSAYLVDDDRVITFNRTKGVSGDVPAAGVAESPVPVEAGGTAYLVYRAAGLIVRLSTRPVTMPAGGALGVPLSTPSGQLWVSKVDTGELCTVGQTALSCPARAPAGHPAALAMLNGGPGFVDLAAGTWQPLRDNGTGAPIPFGVSLPANALVGTSAVGGRLPIIDPTGQRLLLVATQNSAITVPLGPGHFGRPAATGGAVAVVNADTGTIASYDANGKRRDEATIAGSGMRLASGGDGRVYADSTDGLQTVIMDGDGDLVSVATTETRPTSYLQSAAAPPAALPPATVAPTTTETIPPTPETVTVQASPTTGAAGATPGAIPGSSTRPHGPTTTKPPPGPPPGSPTVDVLRATASGSGQATIQIKVSGPAPVFCHVYFNSIERAATSCSGTMEITVDGLATETTYDIYALGTNANGTGNPGRRAQLRL